MDTAPKIERIILATDFLESSRLALDYAVAFAHHFHTTLRMLHVVELSSAAMAAEVSSSRPSISRQGAVERLEALAAGVRRTGISVETIIREGIPAEEIIAAASANCCDLLVLGVHGVHRGVEHLLIGSNTEKILLSATCPTLTVGAHVLAGVDLEMKPSEVLYFADFTPESAAAAPWATFLARSFHVNVDISQLLPPLPGSSREQAEQLAEHFCDTLRRSVTECDAQWHQPAFQLEHGFELEGILRRAESEHAGLIVLGVCSPTRLNRHLHSSFAYELIARATCPVLTILRNPEGSQAEESGRAEDAVQQG